MRLAHLSDLHFGEHAEAAPEALARALADAEPDAVLVSGDLTRRAQEGEFLAAWRFLNALAAPLLVVPGNHDIPRFDLWRRFLMPRKAWRRHAPPGVTALELPGLSVIGLDTVRRAQWHLDWSAGGVPSARLEGLAAALARRASARCLVLCHHPLRMPAGSRRSGVAGAPDALRLLQAQRVTAVLSGHLHESRLLEGTPAQIITPSALSTRGGIPGWSLIEVQEDGIGVRFSGGEAGLVPWA